MLKILTTYLRDKGIRIKNKKLLQVNKRKMNNLIENGQKI